MDYIIKPGDTLSAIARANNTDVATLAKLNKINNPNLIQAGASLKLTADQLAPTAATQPMGYGTATPQVDPNKDIVTQGARAGLSLEDLSGLLGQNDTSKIQDDLAKTYGYSDFQDFVNKALMAPSKTTQQAYEDAYKAAGLDQQLQEINTRKAQLADAEGQVSDNPWYSEASRVGRVKRLQDLANADIQNKIDAYNLSHNKVADLVNTYAQDMSTSQQARQAQFQFLQKQIEDKVAQGKLSTLGKYLGDYNTAKSGLEAPKTVTVGDTLLSYDPKTQAWKTVGNYAQPKTQSAPASYLEWQYAGGEKGTGKTFAQWASSSGNKQPTDAQFNNATYAMRMSQANPIIDKLESEISKMNLAEYYSQMWSPIQSIKSETIQSYDQAARNLINAQLRKESGAAISQAEFDNAYAQYLPMPGDTKTTLAQKRQNRDTIFAGLQSSAGNAYQAPNQSNADPLGIR